MSPMSIDVVCQFEHSPLYALEIARKLKLEVADWSLRNENGKTVLTLVSTAITFSGSWAETAPRVQAELDAIENVLLGTLLGPAELAIAAGEARPSA